MSNITDFLGGSGAAPWVSGTTYAVGKVVLSPADNYQSYVRVIAGAGTTDPSSDSTNWKPIGARAIKSIQRGVINITVASATATITSVNTSKSELRYLGGDGRDGGAVPMVPRLVLTNSTTITATSLQSNGSLSTNVSWELTEHF